MSKYGYGSVLRGLQMLAQVPAWRGPALSKPSLLVSLAVGALSAPAAQAGKVAEQRGQSHSPSLF